MRTKVLFKSYRLGFKTLMHGVLTCLLFGGEFFVLLSLVYHVSGIIIYKINKWKKRPWIWRRARRGLKGRGAGGRKWKGEMTSLYYSLKKKKKTQPVCVMYAHRCMGAMTCMWSGGQRTTLQSQLSLFTFRWVLEIEFIWSGLVWQVLYPPNHLTGPRSHLEVCSSAFFLDTAIVFSKTIQVVCAEISHIEWRELFLICLILDPTDSDTNHTVVNSRPYSQRHR